MERLRRSGLFIPEYELCSSFGVREIDPVNQACAICVEYAGHMR